MQALYNGMNNAMGGHLPTATGGPAPNGHIIDTHPPAAGARTIHPDYMAASALMPTVHSSPDQSSVVSAAKQALQSSPGSSGNPFDTIIRQAARSGPFSTLGSGAYSPHMTSPTSYTPHRAPQLRVQGAPTFTNPY